MTSPQSEFVSAPMLSICIPTYNRGAFLPDLLASIVREIDALPAALVNAEVEVVISDNASNDDTEKRVADFKSILNIKYIRQNENLGPDRNFLSAVEHAVGEYCWLMGSDDIVEIGALESVLTRLSDWDVAGLSVNYARRSFDLSQKSPVRPPVHFVKDIVVEGMVPIYTHFVGHWGYLSGHVVRRDLWQTVVATREPLCFLNSYVHVLVMARMVELLPRWGYVHHICVGWRGRNDSFVTKDHVERMMIDVVGYRDITQHLFGKSSKTTAYVQNSIAGTHVLVHYRIAKVFNHSSDSLRRAAWTLTKEYWTTRSYWSRLLPWILMPAPILNRVWVGYQRLRYRINSSFPIHPQARRRD